jgi:nitroreductase
MAEPKGITCESFLDLVKSRRSIRHYLPDAVPIEMVEQMLEAGRWAPSANNQQPWAFVVVQDKEIRQQIAQHAAFFGDAEAHIEAAPLLIVLCGHVRSRVYHKFLRGELGMAGMQIMLQAHLMGLGTCWVDGLDQEAIARILQVPQDMRVIAMLTVGFPAERPEPTSRKPLFEIAHYDIYDSLTF